MCCKYVLEKKKAQSSAEILLHHIPGHSVG